MSPNELKQLFRLIKSGDMNAARQIRHLWSQQRLSMLDATHASITLLAWATAVTGHPPPSRYRCVVFDLGNVLIRWAPDDVVQQVFPDRPAHDVFASMRHIWLILNRGELTEAQAIPLLAEAAGSSEAKIIELLDALKRDQTLIPGSLDLLTEVKNQGYKVFCLTDNIREFLDYHAQHSGILEHFDGVLSSSDVGVLKPEAQIYEIFLQRHAANISSPQSVLFMDDLLDNVQGARRVGLSAFQFFDAPQARAVLEGLGVLPPRLEEN